MQIVLKNSQGNTFTKVNCWDKANVAAKAIFKKCGISDLYYELYISDKVQAEGSIDLEPRSFHEPHINNIFTWHLKTWWGNISRLKEPKFGLTKQDIEECKVLLTYLPNN